MCLIIALHLCLNCVYGLYADMDAVKRMGWAGHWDEQRSPERGWGTWHTPYHPSQKEKNETRPCQAVVITTTLAISSSHERVQQSTIYALCSGTAVEDKSSIALFINCDTVNCL